MAYAIEVIHTCNGGCNLLINGLHFFGQVLERDGYWPSKLRHAGVPDSDWSADRGSNISDLYCTEKSMRLIGITLLQAGYLPVEH